MRRVGAGFTLAAMLLLALIFGVRAAEDVSRPEFYTVHVRPIFDGNCNRCHGGMNRRGGLSMSTRMGMLRGGKHGPALIPGDPDGSLLVRLIRHQGPANDPMPMPNKGAKLPDSDIDTIARWVKAGAVMPEEKPKF